MSADLVLHRSHESSLPVPTEIGDIERYATIFAKSGYFQDAQQMAQAAVKIIAGAESGIKPFAAMNGIYIVKGRTSMSANLLATLVKQSGRYNYKIVEISATKCHIDFFENGEPCGQSVFTIEDARKAGTQNLDKYARNMLFARAMSNGVRWYCPDATAGPVYTPEELGEEVDAEGEMVRKPRPPQVVQQETITQQEQPAETPEEKKERQEREIATLREHFSARLKSLRYSGDSSKLLSAISKKDRPVVADMRTALEMDEDAFIAALAEAGVKPAPLPADEDEAPPLELMPVPPGSDPFADTDPPASTQTMAAMAR